MAKNVARWFEYCRPHLEELNPKVDLEPKSYVKEMVARAVEMHSDLLVIIADIGGLAIFPSKVAPMSEHTRGFDLMGMLEEETHRRGLRFGAGFVTQCNHYVPKEHPNWQVVDKDGNHPVTKPMGRLCPNSPYRQGTP